MRKKVLGIIAIAIMLLIVLFAVGITINISGVIIINTKYYTTPLEAFTNEDHSSDSSVKELTFIHIDDYNGISVLKTDYSLIVAQMKINSGKYFYMGNKYQYELKGDSIDIGADVIKDSFSMLGNKLKSSFLYGGKIYCEIIMTTDKTDEGGIIYTSVLPVPYSKYSVAYYTTD